MFADMRQVSRVGSFRKVYPLTLASGAQIFSEFTTVEAYMADQLAQKQARVTNRREKIWESTRCQPNVVGPRRKITADGRYDQSNVIRPTSPVVTANALFGSLIAAELQKAGL